MTMVKRSFPLHFDSAHIDDCFPDCLELVLLELLWDQDIGQIDFCNKIDGCFVCATALEL